MTETRGLLPLRTPLPADALPPVWRPLAPLLLLCSGWGYGLNYPPPPSFVLKLHCVVLLFFFRSRRCGASSLSAHSRLPTPSPRYAQWRVLVLLYSFQVTETRGLLTLRTPLLADALPPVWRPLASLLLLCLS